MSPSNSPLEPPHRTPCRIVYSLEALGYVDDCRTFFFFFLPSSSLTAYCNFDRSASYTDFSTSKTASPVLPVARTALPALCTKVETVAGSFH